MCHFLLQPLLCMILYNRLKTVTGAGSSSKSYDFTNGYDDRGNVISDGIRSYTYNLADQMVSSGTNSYVYDGNNKRVKECSTCCNKKH